MDITEERLAVIEAYINEDLSQKLAEPKRIPISLLEGEHIVRMCQFRDKIVIATQTGLWVMDEAYDMNRAYFRFDRVPI